MSCDLGLRWVRLVSGEVELFFLVPSFYPSVLSFVLSMIYSRGWRNEDPEPRVGGGESGRRPKKKK